MRNILCGHRIVTGHLRMTRHYLDGVGVPPAHAAFALHAGDSWLPQSAVLNEHVEGARRALLARGVPPGAITVEHGRYTDSRRLAVVKAYAAALPTEAWLIFADADEFTSAGLTQCPHVCPGWPCRVHSSHCGVCVAVRATCLT